MGTFSNIQYNQTVENLANAANSKLNNPYYIFSDKKPTTVTYYQQNKFMSTLDEAAKINYQSVGNLSPLKFNKINGFVLYGIKAIEIDYDLTDFGTEAGPITGDAIILPNTIIPYPGDFFVINYVKEALLFKVNTTSIDTLDTGNNVYHIEYQMSMVDKIDEINQQVVKTYNFVASNISSLTDNSTINTSFDGSTDPNSATSGNVVGGNGCLIEEGQYNSLNNLAIAKQRLIDYYNDFFFREKLQTYVYTYNGYYMYDPYMIEFIRRNKLFGDYYVAHATTVEKTFSYSYSKSIFACIEEKDSTNLSQNAIVTADLITDPNSLFVNRMDEYYVIRRLTNNPYAKKFSIFSTALGDHILNGTTFSDNNNAIYNTIINYLSGNSYIGEDFIDMLESIDYKDSKDVFYLIPILIYMIGQYNTSMLSSS